METAVKVQIGQNIGHNNNTMKVVLENHVLLNPFDSFAITFPVSGLAVICSPATAGCTDLRRLVIGSEVKCKSQEKMDCVKSNFF